MGFVCMLAGAGVHLSNKCSRPNRHIAQYTHTCVGIGRHLPRSFVCASELPCGPDDSGRPFRAALQPIAACLVYIVYSRTKLIENLYSASQAATTREATPSVQSAYRHTRRKQAWTSALLPCPCADVDFLGEYLGNARQSWSRQAPCFSLAVAAEPCADPLRRHLLALPRRNPATLGMCSKCFRDEDRKAQAKQDVAAQAVAATDPAQTADVVAAPASQPAADVTPMLNGSPRDVAISSGCPAPAVAAEASFSAAAASPKADTPGKTSTRWVLDPRFLHGTTPRWIGVSSSLSMRHTSLLQRCQHSHSMWFWYRSCSSHALTRPSSPCPPGASSAAKRSASWASSAAVVDCTVASTGMQRTIPALTTTKQRSAPSWPRTTRWCRPARCSASDCSPARARRSYRCCTCWRSAASGRPACEALYLRRLCAPRAFHVLKRVWPLTRALLNTHAHMHLPCMLSFLERTDCVWCQPAS
jgi:hypothetical protein